MATKKNMRVNGKEYFRITKTIGHKYVDGKKIPIRKQFLGSSKRAAEQAYEKWKEEQRRKNEGIINDDRTFIEIADYYRDNILSIDSKYSPNTRDSYTSVYNSHIRTYRQLCEKRLIDVTSEDIQVMYNSLNVKEGVMGVINSFMKALYHWLCANKYSSDLLSGVIIPEKEKTSKDEIIVWTDDELFKISNSIADHRLRFLVLLAPVTGMRISELLGLKYSDFKDGFVSVRRQCCKGKIMPPKYNSNRQIPIHDMLIKELKRHKDWHYKEMKAKGYNTEYVFTTKTGGFYQSNSIRNALKCFYKKNDIPYKKFHAFRATFCSNLCKAGVPIQIASKLMGHKSVEITAKFYTAIGSQEQIAAIQSLPDLTAQVK